MDSVEHIISLSLYGLAVVSTASFLMLLLLYRGKDRADAQKLKQASGDVTDMMLLFQTMRDVVTQQKALARDFNKELDRKMGLVKQVLVQGIERNERLYERQQGLVKELEDARAKVDRLDQQLKSFNAPVHAASQRIQPPHEVQKPPDLAAATLSAAPRATAEVAAPSFADWDTSDFRPDEAALYLGDAEEETPAAPEDPQGARDAFRALLDLGPIRHTLSEQGVPAVIATPAAPQPQERIQQRVAEYSRAGMTVSEIARELGIGKGEIRVMLNLTRS